MFTKVGKFFKQAFSSKYLLYSNIAISTTLSGTGDIIEQRYEIYIGELERWDYVRTNHMSVSGITLGVVCHYWYKFLDRRLPGHTIGLVMKKIAIDQLVFTPFGIVVFFATIAALERSSYLHFKQELLQKAWRLYVADCVCGPPSQFVNFYFLPTRFRVLYDSTISLGYDIYASYVKNRIQLEDEPR